MKVRLDTRPFPPPVLADYSASIVKNELKIVDCDLGNMSVTNDLEAVLLEVFRNLVPNEVDFPDLKIRYRDSSGIWDWILIDRDLTADYDVYTAEVVSGALDPDPLPDPVFQPLPAEFDQ